MTEKEEKKMPTIAPMKIKFESEKEREQFISWAESKEKSNSPKAKRVRSGVNKIREMRRKGIL